MSWASAGPGESDLTGRFPAPDVVAVLLQRLPAGGLDGVIGLVGWVNRSAITQPDLRTAMPIAGTTLRVCNPRLHAMVPAPGQSDEQVRAWSFELARLMGDHVQLRRFPPGSQAPGGTDRRWIGFDQLGTGPAPSALPRAPWDRRG